MFGRRSFLIGSASLCGMSATGLAATENSDMPSVPFLTITAPGVYHVTTDYTATSDDNDAIVVATGVHNVTILLYSRLECPDTFSTGRTNAGVRLDGSNSCTIIGMGGLIRGFGFGIRADDCDSLSVERVNIPDAMVRGMMITGDNSYVVGNRVSSIFGSTWTTDQYCIGIETTGAGPIIMGNVVKDFRGTNDGEGVGISISDQGDGGIIKGNISAGSTINGEPRAKSIGYWVGGASDVGFVHNHVENCNWGVAASSPTMGLFDENSFRNCNTSFVEDQGDWIVGGVDG